MYTKCYSCKELFFGEAGGWFDMVNPLCGHCFNKVAYENKDFSKIPTTEEIEQKLKDNKDYPPFFPPPTMG